MSQCYFLGAIPGVVGNNTSGRPFHKGGDALIFDPHNQNGHVCHFVLGGRMVVSPQTILEEKMIDMINRQRTCDKVISLF